MPQIAHLIRIQAPRERVFLQVATTEGIAKWFTEAVAETYTVGGTLELRFPGERVSFRIAELEPSARVVWRCISKDNAWFDTDIVFAFEQQRDRTIVRFDHAGWPELTDLFRDCSMSWAYFLESLKSLIETGR